VNLFLAAAQWIGDTAARIAIRLDLATYLAAAVTAVAAAEPDVYGACTVDTEPWCTCEHRPGWAHDTVPTMAAVLDAYDAREQARQDEIRRLDALYALPAAKEHR